MLIIGFLNQEKKLINPPTVIDNDMKIWKG